MKSRIKKILQKIFGFKNYLFVFSIYIIKTLKWNRKENDFLHFITIIPDGGIILDIGANIGVMTYYLSRKFQNSQIFSFEPIPHNLVNLKRIIKKFNLNNIKVFEMALGNENGNVEMVMPVFHNVKFHGLSHVVDGKNSELNEGEKFISSIKRLDEIKDIKEATFPVNAIKIDVENYEYFVFQGGIETIKKHKPVIYTELWDNENRQNSFKLLCSLGYKTKVLQNGELINFDPEKHKTQNFFFIPND